MAKRQPLPINAAGRLALWVYPRVTVSRFPNAPPVVETTRGYEMPNFDALPDGAEIEVELWGGAVRLSLDGERGRVYWEKFEHVTFAGEREARAAFLDLWERVKRRESVAEVIGAISGWRVVNGVGDR